MAATTQRVLLFGGSGQLGTEIRRRWSDVQIVAPSSSEVNIEDADAVARALDAASPDLVVNCAAFHNVDRCEVEPERAFAVNALAVDRIAALCDERGCAFMTISTDYVFDGETNRPYVESDAPHPISVYGTSKLAGELLVLRRRSRTFVVRTCGVYGIRASSSKGHTFIDRVLAKAAAGEEIRIVDDVIASPTYAGHLAQALQQIARSGSYGLYHACAAGPVSWYDFAAEALRQHGVEYPLTAIHGAEWKAGARRPAFSALESQKLHALGIDIPPWQQGIHDYLRDRVVFA